MTVAEMIDMSSAVALIVLGVALFVSTIRIIIGPTLGDRILALDLMTLVAMCFIGAVAIRTGSSLYLDIALALALLGFLATLALVRYMLSRPRQEPEETEESA